MLRCALNVKRYTPLYFTAAVARAGALDVAVGSTNAGKSRGGMRLPQRFTALFDAVPLSRTAIPGFDRAHLAGYSRNNVETSLLLHDLLRVNAPWARA